MYKAIDKKPVMKDFDNYYTIKKASVEEVYNALTNPFTLELWTGYPAEMDTRPGGLFSLWEGDIQGQNLEIVPNKKIVQEWFFGEQEEPSIVTIKLFSDKKGVKVHLQHTNIPEEAYDNMKEGWNDFYFGNLQRFFDL